MPLKTIAAKKQIPLGKLARVLGVPGEELVRALSLGGVQVNGRRVKDSGTVVPAGAVLSVCWGEDPPPFCFDPNWIVFEDDCLICMNKPAGMTTQGTRCFDVNHLYFFVKAYLDGYAGLHHRLDRDTTGLVLFTKKRSVNRAVGGLFQKKMIQKSYLAPVHGELNEPITVKLPIGRVPGLKPARFWVNGDNAKAAETKIRPLAVKNGYTLVEALPLTGRTHQVRVHLAASGHPIAGDSFYNHNEVLRHLRPLLHCRRLSFPHPVSGTAMELNAPLPEDFKSFLEENGFEAV
ncbi:MAG: RluA family pseudouridine synthase [Acidobacteria bacterium]|nr:RluA family pseudouridine synthase [Acidobacteriota bacterium]